MRSTAEKTSRTTIIFAEPPHFAGVIPNLNIDVAEILHGGFQRSFVGWRDDFLARNHAVVFVDLIDAVIWHGVPFREQRPRTELWRMEPCWNPWNSTRLISEPDTNH